MKEVWGFGAVGFDLMGCRKMVVRAISRHGGSGGRSGKGMCGGWAVGSGVCEGGCSGCIKRVPPYPCLALEESQKVPYPPKPSDVEAACLPGPKNAPPYCPLGLEQNIHNMQRCYKKFNTLGNSEYGETKGLGFVRVVVSLFGHVVPKQVNDGEAQGASAGQDKLLNTQLGSEAVGPAQLYVGDGGDKRLIIEVEPVEERIVELAQGAHLGLEGVSGQVLDVLEAGGDEGRAEGGLVFPIRK
ncbi:unnamed protein product [Prunus armeniaca]|uniref:Uncharacterized protein n=1 Tax=Prunus armeniaca TaxID=36596 RepID=A0A6J5WYW4_PRUAR|nr:unnamed protein product [Prunus armeniaca]